MQWCDRRASGFVVWAHAHVSVGMSSATQAYFVAATMVIAVPTRREDLLRIATMLVAGSIESIHRWRGPIGFIFLSRGRCSAWLLATAGVDGCCKPPIMSSAHFLCAFARLVFGILPAGPTGSAKFRVYMYMDQRQAHVSVFTVIGVTWGFFSRSHFLAVGHAVAAMVDIPTPSLAVTSCRRSAPTSLGFRRGGSFIYGVDLRVRAQSTMLPDNPLGAPWRPRWMDALRNIRLRSTSSKMPASCSNGRLGAVSAAFS